MTRHTAIGIPTLMPLTFGSVLLDLDNDGWLDLVIAYGHVEPDISVSVKQREAQPFSVTKTKLSVDPLGDRPGTACRVECLEEERSALPLDFDYPGQQTVQDLPPLSVRSPAGLGAPLYG